MKTYQIHDAQVTSLLAPLPVVEASRPIEAARKYLASIGELGTLKVSASNYVRVGVMPCVIENGKVWRLPERNTWFEFRKS